MIGLITAHARPARPSGGSTPGACGRSSMMIYDRSTAPRGSVRPDRQRSPAPASHSRAGALVWAISDVIGQRRGWERMKVIVGKVSDFANGDRKIIDVNGKSIGVFRVDDRFYALRNRCPHQFGPLCVGTLAQRAVSDGPGDLRMDDGPPLIACPWHGWEYDLATGQSFMGPGRGNLAALSYEVTVQPGGEVAAPRADGRIPGPYVAETMPVSVEQDYVLVDDSPTRQKEARA